MVEQFRPGLPGLRPSARALDMFVRPRQTAAPVRPAETNAFLELAGALGTVHQPIMDILDKQEEERRRQEEAQGAIDAITGAGPDSGPPPDPKAGITINRLAVKEAIDEQRTEDRRTGETKADRMAAMSPHYRRGFERSHLDSLGMIFEDVVTTAWRENPEVQLSDGSTLSLHQTDDPRAFAAWMQDQRAAFMEQHDVAGMDPTMVMEALLPRMQSAASKLANRQNEYRLAQVQTEAKNAFSTNLQLFAGEGLKTGNLNASVTGLQQRLDSAVLDGMDPRVANQTLVEGIITLAKSSGDASVMGILEKIDTGNGKLGNVGWVKEAVRSATVEIDEHEIRNERNEAWREENQRKEDLDAVMGNAARDLLDNPAADISGYKQKLTDTGNWQQALALDGMQDRMINQQSTVPVNSRAYTKVRAAIYDARTPEERSSARQMIIEGVGVHFNHDQVGQLFDDLDRNQSRREFIDDTHVSGMASLILSRVDSRFPNDQYGEGNVAKGLEARTLFYAEMDERIEEARAAGTEITKTFLRRTADEVGKDVLNSPLYERDESLGPVSDRVRTPEELRARGFGQGAQHDIGSILQAAPGTVAFNPQTLPEEQVLELANDHLLNQGRSIITQIAARHGTDPSTLLEGLGVPQVQPEIEPAAEPVAETEAEQIAAPQDTSAEPGLVELELPLDSRDTIEGLLDIVGANGFEQTISNISLGNEITPFIEQLQSAGIVREIRSRRGGTTFSVDYDEAMEVLGPTIEALTANFGLDPQQGRDRRGPSDRDRLVEVLESLLNNE